MRDATIVRRERVPAWSACAFLMLSRRNRGWLDLSPTDRNALRRLVVAADDRGVAKIAPARHLRTDDCAVCAAKRLTAAGFLRTTGPRWTERRLALPRHLEFLARRSAFQEDTASGRRFYELMGYGTEWRRGRAKVAAAVARVLGRRRKTNVPRERLEE